MASRIRIHQDQRGVQTAVGGGRYGDQARNGRPVSNSPCRQELFGAEAPLVWTSGRIELGIS